MDWDLTVGYDQQPYDILPALKSMLFSKDYMPEHMPTPLLPSECSPNTWGGGSQVPPPPAPPRPTPRVQGTQCVCRGSAP